MMVEFGFLMIDRKSTRLNSSHLVISYAVFCLKKNEDDKIFFQPFSVADDFRHGATVDLRVEEIGIHRGAVIAPDGEVRDGFFFNDRSPAEFSLFPLLIALRN